MRILLWIPLVPVSIHLYRIAGGEVTVYIYSIIEALVGKSREKKRDGREGRE